ncbi:MAG: hypothetical protein KAS32_01610 [Candidatus Peribacteraceae bacterium]|nr:hypothetical protein [Candidatus Peribacteraceae bacterium]
MEKGYPKIKAYLEKIDDKTSNLNSIYIRNFRELIKFLPFVGPIIDANTMGAIEDRNLKKRLTDLERTCENVLNLDDIDGIMEQVTLINALFFTIIAQYQELIFKENREIKDILNKYVVIPKNTQMKLSPNPTFRLIIISGASATGKDILIDLLNKEYFPQHSRCEILTKFTTRKKRATESDYYKFLTEKQFQNYKDNNRIIFYYTKRGFQYGFDKSHLFKAATSDTLLFCVFTEFKILPHVKQFLKEQGLNVISILLEAPEKHLIHRSWFRSLPEEEVKTRITSIKRDITYIKKNRPEIEKMFDYIIYNGDDRAKLDTYEELKMILLNKVSNNTTDE